MARIARHRIVRIATLLVALTVAIGPAAAASGSGLTGQLQCPCDCGKYLSVCDCATADTARSYVKQLQEQGYSNAEIADAFGEKYGSQFVEFVPKGGSGLSLWLTPLAGVIVGAAGVFVYVRRFRDPASPEAVSVCPDCGTDVEVDAEYCPSCGSSIDDSW